MHLIMIDYIRKNSPRARQLRLHVDRDGSLVVTAPPFVTRAVIEKFIQQNAGWIKKHQDKRAQSIPTQGGQFALFGHNYRLEFGYRPQLPSGWQVVDECLFYNNSRYLLAPKTEPTLTPPEKASLERFGRQTIRAYIVKRLPQLHAQMKIPQPFARITIKDQGTRWGSCSSDNNLNFNWRLVHYPPEVIDYVLIHELAHMVHLDHSARFWALVAKYDGQYKLHQRQLR